MTKPNNNWNDGQEEKTDNGLLIKTFSWLKQNFFPEDDDGKMRNAGQPRQTEPAPKPQTKPSDAEPQKEMLRQAALRRTELEERIMALIGGKTGMSAIWELLVDCARQNDETRFVFWSHSFMEKAEALGDLFRKLMDIIHTDKREAPNDPLSAFVYSPFPHEEECQDLMGKAEALKGSGLIGAEMISGQALTDWAERVQKETRAAERGK